MLSPFHFGIDVGVVNELAREGVLCGLPMIQSCVN